MSNESEARYLKSNWTENLYISPNPTHETFYILFISICGCEKDLPIVNLNITIKLEDTVKKNPFLGISELVILKGSKKLIKLGMKLILRMSTN